MHWDMAGISGIFSREQVWFWEERVSQQANDEGRALLIADINSAAAAFLPHTGSPEWAGFRTNGQSVGEMGIEACFAGHWDIPAIFAQSDTAACRRADVKFSRRCMYAYTSRASRVPLSRRPVTPGAVGDQAHSGPWALAAGPQRPR
jgi:D-aminopeptidase